MTTQIFNADCLIEMKKLEDKSVDLMICDLPYGETNCKWDCKIDLDEFWKEFKRIRKSKRTACIHFCSTKFGYTLIKSNEKMFKMDMVWKKRNKTGGLQSRHRPMRNHEMVYFFYEQAPKYNRDKYHKRIQAKNPIVKEEGAIFGKGYEKGKEPPFCKSKFFEPPNPVSVVEEKDIYGETKEERKKRYKKNGTGAMNPPNPASVVEEKDPRINEKGKSPHGWDIEHMDKPRVAHFDPKLPVSVLEEKYNSSGYKKELVEGVKNFGTYGFEPPNPASVVEEEKDEFGWDKSVVKEKGNKIGKIGGNFEPTNPVSIVEEDEPKSMFESTKVFIGKRHHQTEKPLDILEFFLKYWTDEGDTVLDPTMGSGSTGVACKQLKRNFIGYELDPDIFKVAEKRLDIKMI